MKEKSLPVFGRLFVLDAFQFQMTAIFDNDIHIPLISKIHPNPNSDNVQSSLFYWHYRRNNIRRSACRWYHRTSGISFYPAFGLSTYGVNAIYFSEERRQKKGWT